MAKTIRESQSLPERGVTISDFPDIENICIRESDSLLKIEGIEPRFGKRRIRIFKKIAPSPYDFYILDPEINFHDMDYFCKIEHFLYKQGYKLLEQTYIDIDGVVAEKIRHIYDECGLLKREEKFNEAPWGEFIVNNIKNGRMI